MIATAFFDNQLWVLGGSYATGDGPGSYIEFLNDVWSSADGANWVQASTPAWLPREGFDAAAFHNRLWVLGGRTPGPEGSFLLNDVWYMAPDPGASFSGTPWSGVAPLTVQFTDDSTADAAPISSWNWDFGDGTSSTDRNPSHTYATRGIYTVSLTVTAGDFYNTDTEEAYISVTGEQHPFHTADQNQDNKIALSELLRVIQFFNSGGLHCQSGTEDGYAPGPGDTTACALYDSDYHPPDWRINLTEVLRVIQFFNMQGYHACPADGTEDGYCPGVG
jgi:PKD repeat protein